jgi:hypothetical protein
MVKCGVLFEVRTKFLNDIYASFSSAPALRWLNKGGIGRVNSMRVVGKKSIQNISRKVWENETHQNRNRWEDNINMYFRK